MMQNGKMRLVLVFVCAAILFSMTGCGNLFGDSERKVLSRDEIREIAQKATVKVTVFNSQGFKMGSGSGFFIDDQGTFVTAFHVISDGVGYIDVTSDEIGTISVDRVIAFNPVNDIAVLKANTTRPTSYLKICEELDAVQTLDVVYAAGWPADSQTLNLTAGEVSSASIVYGLTSFFQITAPISGGNSGGPLINEYGEVIGVNALSNSRAQNMNLAVKMSMLDNIGSDVNYTLPRYAEWWQMQTDRSYHIYNTEEDTYALSLINTYQSVISDTKCIASFDENDRSQDGYVAKQRKYKYEFNQDRYDAYRRYLESIGFEFNAAKSENAGPRHYYYMDRFEGNEILMRVDDAEQYLYISVFY